jgi:hypothetical protein
MRRDFSVLKGENGLEPGDDYAASKATALAQLADAGVIEKLTQAVSMLDLFGGQVYVQAVRRKFDANGDLIPVENAKDTPGRWETVGFAFRFDTADPLILQHRGQAFVVPGPIEESSADDAELAHIAATEGPPQPEANGQPAPEEE